VFIPKKLKHSPIQLKPKVHPRAHPINNCFLKLLEEPRIEHNNDDETQEEISKKDEMEVEEEQKQEHEDIINLEKALSRKMKTSAANKPKKVVRGGGPSPLKKSKKSKPKPILEWVLQPPHNIQPQRTHNNLARAIVRFKLNEWH